MKTKRVLRYYCDYCKKGGCSKYHIRMHEEHCTLNPNRICRMCEISKNEQAKIEDMLAILPNVKDYPIENDILHNKYCCLEFDNDITVALQKLRTMTNNCPACILAALRQKKISVYMVTDFDYSEEVKDFWEEINS